MFENDLLSQHTRFVVVDVETTGLSPARDRITEIALVVSDGTKILEEHVTLLNPEMRVSGQITALTGITNDMLAGAPKFQQIAKKIIELTENSVVVGHNVRFDFGFLSAEFGRLGFPFRKKSLCTVQLARKLYPGFESYKLSSLKEFFKIAHEGRAHRALADAQVTAHLFHEFLKNKVQPAPKSFISNTTPPLMRDEEISQLPEATGVYYFLNAEGHPIYVGKAKNIKERVKSHFSADMRHARERKIKELVAKIEFKETHSELVALLFEAHEIKRLKPVFNRAQRRESNFVGIYANQDPQSGVWVLHKERLHPQNPDPLQSFVSFSKAQQCLDFWIEEHELCEHLTHGLEYSRRQKGPCFAYQLDRCHGICVGKESVEDYNQRINKLLHPQDALLDQPPDFLIREILPQSQLGDALVLVEKGHYKGYGFYKSESPEFTLSEALKAILPNKESPDIPRILRQFLKNEIPNIRVYPLEAAVHRESPLAP